VSVVKKSVERSGARDNLRFLEARVLMLLRSPSEDLRDTTLAARPGLWSKLLYFARLRRGDDSRYHHWGLQQKYGKEADRALQRAHTDVLGEMLRTPLPDLLIDLEANGESERLLDVRSVEPLTPVGADKESKSHLLYIVTSVLSLLNSRKNPRE